MLQYYFLQAIYNEKLEKFNHVQTQHDKADPQGEAAIPNQQNKEKELAV